MHPSIQVISIFVVQTEDVVGPPQTDCALPTAQEQVAQAFPPFWALSAEPGFFQA
jgi:hypothetical protein